MGTYKEPTFRPYQELTQELAEKLIGKVVKNKNTKSLSIIVSCITNSGLLTLNYKSYSLKELFDIFTFIDDSPIGEEVTE